MSFRHKIRKRINPTATRHPRGLLSGTNSESIRFLLRACRNDGVDKLLFLKWRRVMGNQYFNPQGGHPVTSNHILFMGRRLQPAFVIRKEQAKACAP